MIQKYSKYSYLWPDSEINENKYWKSAGDYFFEREMPEQEGEFKNDSKWPAFYPSPICMVTASDGGKSVLERSVGATIVNRFPYIIALAFCRDNLSKRHYDRNIFRNMAEENESVAVQFLPPGPFFDKALDAVNKIAEEDIFNRIQYSGLPTHKAFSSQAPVFDCAYMVYEASLVKPCKDFNGNLIYEKPYVDIGSHRLYFFEIKTIQLRKDIAEGDSQIYWRSLPVWNPVSREYGYLPKKDNSIMQKKEYRKGYTANYFFPSSKTTAFAYDFIQNDMAVKHLPSMPKDQVEIDNDKARWPCFFPSPLTFITTWADHLIPNIMPCGSTMVVSRHPMTIAVSVAYAAINTRYNVRATLDIMRKTKTFGCGVPYIDDRIIDSILYSGNVSFAEDSKKVENSGLQWEYEKCGPVITAFPIHFDCRVVDEIQLGTHSMFLGEVCKIKVRKDVRLVNPIEWIPITQIHNKNE